jgi:hypothetical protein
MPFRISVVHAFTCIGDDGDEGVVAFQTPLGWMPMIGADPTRLAQLEPIAKDMASRLGKQITLKRFSQMETVGTYEPEIVEPSED